MNLPVIPHPMSQVGHRPTFSIQGQSQLLLPCHSYLGQSQAEHPFVNSSLPLLTDQRKVTTRKVFELPDRKCQDDRKGKFSKLCVVCSSLDELESLVQEKVTTGTHGVKCMFKANDPMGIGTVSRGAFMKILCNLVGYVSVDQFNRLIRRLGLDCRPRISFEEFMSCYQENEHIGKEWIAPLQLMRMREGDHWEHPEQALREDVTYRTGFISVPLCLDLLKQKVRQRGFRLTDYLPNLRCDEDGRILPPQLSQFLGRLGLRVTEEDFKSLWERYDREGAGAIKTLEFFKALGLNEYGTPRPSTTDSFFSLRSSRRSSNSHPYGKARRNTFLQKVCKKLDERNQTEAIVEEEVQQETENDVTVVRRKTPKPKRTEPKLDGVLDALKYKFEQPYQALLKGMQCFDARREGLIARIDLHKVLAGFGFHILVMDLPEFLSRCGIKTIQGEIVYSELLERFWNRSQACFVHRILKKKLERMTHLRDILPPVADTLTAEELEHRLVEFIHSHFIALSFDLRKRDFNHLGVLPQYEFREAIDTSLGHQISGQQWNALKQQAAIDGDGLVPYTQFLDTFSESPGAWNKREYIGVMVRKVAPIETPSMVERLRTRAEETGDEREVTRGRGEGEEDGRRSWCTDGRSTRTEDRERSQEQLTEIVEELFRCRFYEIDKAFRDFDRKMTGRCHKEQFGDLLRRCNIQLSGKEVDSLWEVVETSSDNMVTFAKLVSRFAGYLVKPASRNSTGGMSQREGTPFPSMASRVHCHPSSAAKYDLLRAIRADVLTQWGRLRQIFKHLDKNLTATVSTDDMKDVMALLHFHLTEDEMETLVGEFDLKTDGRFHYIEFMKNFAKKRKHQRMKRIIGGDLGRVIEVTDAGQGHAIEGD